MAKVLGRTYREFSFNDKQTNQPVLKKGCTLYFLDDIQCDIGQSCGSEFIGIDKPGYAVAQQLNIGDEFMFIRSRYGRVENLLVTNKNA